VLGALLTFSAPEGGGDGCASEVLGHASGSLPGGVIFVASNTVRFPPLRCVTT
jgi:hypothetical protein